ncbi:MAG: PadR family transcriptional regulator [Bacilli bacterium]|jgi:predicted transcriptional regulator
MTITSDIIRGHTDTIILAHLEVNDSYGYQINKSIQERTGYILKDATLYTAFRRLEDLGYITSYWGDGDTGARRRYYTITKMGRVALAQMKNEWLEAKQIIDKLIHMEE